MLVAANYARGHGADGLVLTSTQLVSRTTHVTSYYVGSYDVNAGYELRLTMRLVDSKHLPADLVGNEWRVIGVEDLISKLRRLERTGRIRIERIEKNYVGPNPINPGTVIVWRRA